MDQRQITKDEGENFARQNRLEFIEISAKTGEHVEEAFILSAKNFSQIAQNLKKGSKYCCLI